MLDICKSCLYSLPYSVFLFVWKWNLTKLAWLATGTIDMTSDITATTVNKRWKGLSWRKSFPAPQEWWVWYSRHNIRRWGLKNRFFQPRVETLNLGGGGRGWGIVKWRPCSHCTWCQTNFSYVLQSFSNLGHHTSLHYPYLKQKLKFFLWITLLHRIISQSKQIRNLTILSETCLNIKAWYCLPGL